MKSSYISNLTPRLSKKSLKGHVHTAFPPATNGERQPQDQEPTSLNWRRLQPHGHSGSKLLNSPEIRFPFFLLNFDFQCNLLFIIKGQGVMTIIRMQLDLWHKSVRRPWKTLSIIFSSHFNPKAGKRVLKLWASMKWSCFIKQNISW